MKRILQALALSLIATTATADCVMIGDSQTADGQIADYLGCTKRNMVGGRQGIQFNFWHYPLPQNADETLITNLIVNDVNMMVGYIEKGYLERDFYGVNLAWLTMYIAKISEMADLADAVGAKFVWIRPPKAPNQSELNIFHFFTSLELAEKSNVIFADCQQAELSWDNLHMSDAGKQYCAQKILEVLP